MRENDCFSINLVLDGSKRRLSISAPVGLSPHDAATAIKKFSGDKEVERELKQLDKNNTVEIVVYERQIIGISINN